MARKTKQKRQSRGAAKARNPLVTLTRKRGHNVESSSKAFKRRPKHPKPPSENGGE